MIDEFDLKILEIVRRNNRTPAEKIAERVGLSASAVQRRLQRLRAEGIIKADVSIVSTEITGQKISAVISVTLEREHTVVLNDFKNGMLNAPEVTHCYFVTGDADFILIASFKDMKEYEKFTRQFFTENSHIKRYHTNIVINQVKSEFTVSLTPGED